MGVIVRAGVFSPYATILGHAALAKVIALVAVLMLLWFGRVAWDYFDPNSPANLGMKVQWQMFGTAMYEYHSQAAGYSMKC
jgi:hypothetical protein